jgi:hypothetical protein
MDYFIDQERPDVVATAAVIVRVVVFVFDYVMLMLTINLCILCEDRTSLRSLAYILHSIQTN